LDFEELLFPKLDLDFQNPILEKEVLEKLLILLKSKNVKNFKSFKNSPNPRFGWLLGR